MRCLRWNPLVIFLFPLLFFIFSTFFALSYGAYADHQIHLLQDAKVPEFLDVNTQRDGIVQPNTRRIAAETAQNSSYLILAAERTRREDPSDGFKLYTGGWNITDSHYLFSVAYSAVGPIFIAIIWFLVFGLYLLCLCICCCCCCRRKSYGYSRAAYAISVICLTLFTLAAIAGIAYLYMGQERFQNSIVDTVGFVLHKADTVIVNLKYLLDNLLAAKDSNVGQTLLPEDIQANIDDIEKTINDVSAKFRDVTQSNSDDIRHVLDPLRLTLIIASVSLLILALLGYLCSILGLQCIMYCLIIIGWILVALTFIMSGVFLLVHNVVADTCVAMGEWLQNPNANSALESIIPKVNNQTAQDIYAVTKGVIMGQIIIVNLQITEVSNADVPANAGPLFYNQSGPLVPVLCNPYDTNLTDRQCAVGELSFKNASQVWRNYVCQTSAASGNCATRGRLTPVAYNQMMTVVNVSSALYTEMPFVVDLIDSTYLKELFGEISKDYCPDLDRHTKWMYLGFFTSSVAVMLSLILWVIYARERRQRKYTKKVDSRSADGINPFGYRQY